MRRSRSPGTLPCSPGHALICGASHESVHDERDLTDLRWGGLEGRLRLPSKPKRNMRSFRQSPRRSHGVPTGARHFHDSLCPTCSGISVGMAICGQQRHTLREIAYFREVKCFRAVRPKAARKERKEDRTIGLPKDGTMIQIDGAMHSGSGTIVRYAVALAVLTGESVRIDHIREKRPKPGLRPQHLAVLRTCSSLCGGILRGGEVGSREIEFEPGQAIHAGEHHIDVGTAGSTTMLAFSLIPVVLFSKGPSRLVLTGGLFQDFAPSAFHMKEVLFPLLRKMGADVSLHMVQPGYVPRGGGILELNARPVREALIPLRMSSRGRVERIEGIALASHLEEQRVARRMAERCERLLRKQGHRARISMVEDSTARQKGAALVVWAMTEKGCIIGADRAGKLGRSSEQIGTFVAHSLLEDLDSGAATDRHSADQLILFSALAAGVTEYTIPCVTDHVETNLWLVETILGARTRLAGNTVTVEGIGYQP